MIGGSPTTRKPPYRIRWAIYNNIARNYQRVTINFPLSHVSPMISHVCMSYYIPDIWVQYIYIYILLYTYISLSWSAIGCYRNQESLDQSKQKTNRLVAFHCQSMNPGKCVSLKAPIRRPWLTDELSMDLLRATVITNQYRLCNPVQEVGRTRALHRFFCWNMLIHIFPQDIQRFLMKEWDWQGVFRRIPEPREVPLDSREKWFFWFVVCPAHDQDMRQESQDTLCFWGIPEEMHIAAWQMLILCIGLKLVSIDTWLHPCMGKDYIVFRYPSPVGWWLVTSGISQLFVGRLTVIPHQIPSHQIYTPFCHSETTRIRPNLVEKPNFLHSSNSSTTWNPMKSNLNPIFCWFRATFSPSKTGGLIKPAPQAAPSPAIVSMTGRKLWEITDSFEPDLEPGTLKEMARRVFHGRAIPGMVMEIATRIFFHGTHGIKMPFMLGLWWLGLTMDELMGSTMGFMGFI